MPRASGDYDPKPATIYQQITTISYAYGREPRQTRSEFCRMFIRFPWLARTDTEFIAQGQIKSVGQIIVRARKNSKTVRLDPSMEMDHDGFTYGIIGLNPIPSNERDEVEFLVQYLRPATLVTP